MSGELKLDNCLNLKTYVFMKPINWKNYLLSLTSSHPWCFWASVLTSSGERGRGFEWFSAVPAMSISPTGLFKFLDNLPPGDNILLFHLHAGGFIAKTAVILCSPLASFLLSKELNGCF